MRTYRTLLVACIVVTSWRLLYNSRTATTQSKKSQSVPKNIVNSITIEGLFHKRVQRLRNGCVEPQQSTKYRIQHRQSTAHFLYSTKYNFTICKVAKGGSTFWTILFLILETTLPAEQLLSTSRHTVHILAGKIPLPLNYKSLKTKRIIVSRDPYTRLFSVFIDKIFLLRLYKVTYDIAKSLGKRLYMTKAGSCGYAITFQDFVDRVTTDGLGGKYIDRHWSPVYTLCRVCDVGYQYVIQQETLTRDTEYITEHLNISKETKTTLMQLFHGSGSRKQIEGVIKSMWSAIDTPTMNSCCSNKLAYIMKIWEGFKIQGYIRTNISFPLSAFQENDSVNVEGITKAVLPSGHTTLLQRCD